MVNDLQFLRFRNMMLVVVIGRKHNWVHDLIKYMKKEVLYERPGYCISEYWH